MSIENLLCGRADWVAAAGLAARAVPPAGRQAWAAWHQDGRVIELGLYLARISAGEVHRDDGMPIVLEVVRYMDMRHRWQLTYSQERRVAEGVWFLLVNPRCPTCRGQKIEPYVCSDCGGTGNREVPRRLHDEISQVLSMIRWIESAVEHSVKRRLG